MPASGEHHPAFEEYCECIFELDEDDVMVIQARIAERLQVSRPAVSEMIRRLDTEGLITTDGAIRLTLSGQALAQLVVRRHRIAERFLTDMLGLSWADAHHEAGKWEHVMSDAVEQAMDRVLGSPTTCPHGNPIPGSSYLEPTLVPLSEVEVGGSFIVNRIPEELEFTPGLLDFLEEASIVPGHSGLLTAASPRWHHDHRDRRPSCGSWLVRQRPHPGDCVRHGKQLTLLVLSITTASCAATTYDTSIQVGSVAPTTTVLPTGSAAELLPQLVTEASKLSELIADHGDKLAVVERIEALWAAVSTDVTAKDREIATEIGAEIAKGRSAAMLNRPAAADKVYRNLTALVQAYLAGA